MKKSRLLHIMLRVKSLEQSEVFYQNIFGMKILHKEDFESGKFTLAFLGYEDEFVETVIELTYNWGSHDYDMGDAFGHLAFEVGDAVECCKRVIENGGQIVKEPGILSNGPREYVAFVKDPNGYLIELIQR